MAEFIRPRGWHKSTRSATNSCVECSATFDHVLVRDSKDPHGPVLTFDPRRWNEFLSSVKDGTILPGSSD
jgi:hypothetical protein